MENTDYAGECVATHRFEPVELLLGEPKFIRSVASLSYTIIIQHDTNPTVALIPSIHMIRCYIPVFPVRIAYRVAP